MIKDNAYYLNLFGVDRAGMEELISEALKGGGDYADLFFEDSIFSDLLLRDGEVQTASCHEDYGVGIRTLCGEKTGYAYSESTARADMISAARAASAISSGMGAGDGHTLPGGALSSGGGLRPGEDLYPVGRDWREEAPQRLVEWLMKVQELVTKGDSRVVKVIATISSQMSEIMMFNSLGEMVCETRPLGALTVSAIFKQGDRTENKTVSRSFRTGTEMLTDELVETLAREVVSGIDQRFEARRPKGGRMSVVMGAGASGILLHEAMGHAFEADFNRKGQSIFSGRIGQRVCPEGITIVDDGTIPLNRGAIRYDDELTPGQRTAMVENGILTSYLHDRISARFYGVAPTGNGRRESFRYNPIPRMRATYMESGQAAPDDIIASVRKGIYVDQFSNGQVKIGEGDFTFYVKSGFLIENGRLTMPVKDINVIGNGPEALADIRAVGNDLRIDDSTWTCGKEQSVPVSCGIPTVLVGNLTVGGQ
ncbi:MAG: TldD/PmbA family protein [Bacteroidales bacterium]|nr:TldD/PmbA family protein [Bacteroidales bacterium]